MSYFISFNKSRNHTQGVLICINALKNSEALKETVNEIFQIESLNSNIPEIWPSSTSDTKKDWEKESVFKITM
jgi:hypothetical protein